MFRDRRVYAVIVAGGRGTRMKAPKPKQFLYIGGKTILEKTVDKFRRSSLVDEIIVVTAQDYLEQTEELFHGFSKSMSIISGGKRRQDSVANALKLLRQKKVSEDDIVLIHDGVRPYIELDLIASVTKEASEAGAAIPCITPKDTIRDINKGTLERSDLRCVQTPQGFSAGLLMDAYAKAFTDGGDFTDDASIVEAFGHKNISVRGLPNTFGRPESERFIYELIDKFSDLEKASKRDSIYDSKYDEIAEIACKSAIKANDKLDYNEVIALLESLKKCDNPYTCPHGRPVMVSMTKYDMEKMFKRKM